MKSMLKKMVAVFCLMIAVVATVEAQNSFAYQAVIRKANGDVVSEKKVSMCFSLIYNNEEVYVETQSPMTDKYGNVQVEIGKGYKVIGDFSKVPWHTMQVMMRIEVDPDGGHNFIDLGAIQLQPAPYAMHAASTGLVIDSSSPKSGSGALFEVKDKDGNVVFAVFPDGVRVYVDDSDGKPVQTGFAVAGRRAAKDGEEANLFSVTSEGTQVIVDDADGKPMATGFAVAGRRAAKDGESDLFTVSSTGTQVYINTDADGKPVQTGFAVAGRRAAKDGGTEKYLEINESGTQVYIDDEADGKPVQTGFAVAGRRAAKGSNDNKYMEVTADGTTVYVDTDGKAMSTGFAVAGRRAAKGKNLKLFQVNRYGTHIFIDEDADDKPVQTGFAVAGRRAAKDEEAKKYMVIDAEGTFIYVDYEDAKAMQTGFAVAGRRAAKDGTPSSILTVNGQEGTHVYIDDADGKAMSTGFAVAGRRAAKEKSFKLFQVTSLGSSMTTGHFSVGNTALDDKVLSVSAGASVIKTNEFVLADETKPTEGEQAVTKSVFQAKSGEGVTIAEESQVVVKGDVGRAIMTKPLMAGNGIELPGSIIVDNRIVDTLCSEYAEVLGEPDGYKLLKIHGKGLFTINDNYNLNGNAVIMFNKSGKVTYSSKSAVLAVILTSPDWDETGESKLVFWPCCPISDTLNIKFGLMAAGTTDTYLEVEAIVYPTDGVSRVKYIADPKMGTIKSDIVPFYGSKASFTAEAKKGYEFERWIVQTKQVNGEEGRFNEEGEWNEYYKNPLTLAIGWDSIYLEAEFMPIQIGYFAHPGNGGEIEVRQKCDGCVTTIGNIQVKVDYTTIAKGNEGFITSDQMPEVDSLTFVAQPKPGFKFICWNGKEELTDSIITVKVDQSMELVAFFEGEGQQSESDNNTIGTKDNHSNNQWHVGFFELDDQVVVTDTTFGFVEGEGAYVKFKADENSAPHSAQFNNFLKGLPNQNEENSFMLSFEAMWVPDEEVYGDDAPRAAKIYMKTGKNPDYSSSSTGYQWDVTNTELLYNSEELYRQYCPKLMNNKWNSYFWDATIGKAGATQIGIEMDLIDGQPGNNSGTFWFRNIEVYMGGEVVAQYFMVDVPEQQQKRYNSIEIIEPISDEPLISIYTSDGDEIDYSYSEKVEIDGGYNYRSYTYFTEFEVGEKFTFVTQDEPLSLRAYARGAFSKVIDQNSFNDVESYKVEGRWAFNEKTVRYEREVIIPLDNILVADYGEDLTGFKIMTNGEVDVKFAIDGESVDGEYERDVTIDDVTYSIYYYECDPDASVYLTANSKTKQFKGWYWGDENMDFDEFNKYDDPNLSSSDYSFGAGVYSRFVALFEENVQQENNGDKATIQILTNGEARLIKSGSTPDEDEELTCIDTVPFDDPGTGEFSGGYIYTYNCNVGDKIELLGAPTTEQQFMGWYGNFDKDFSVLNFKSLSGYLLSQYVLVEGQDPDFKNDYTFVVEKETNRFMANFADEATIEILTTSTISVQINEEQVTLEDPESVEYGGVQYNKYTFKCYVDDYVSLTANGTQQFSGWYEVENFENLENKVLLSESAEIDNYDVETAVLSLKSGTNRFVALYEQMQPTGSVIKVKTDGIGEVEFYTYNDQGKLTAITNVAGQVFFCGDELADDPTEGEEGEKNYVYTYECEAGATITLKANGKFFGGWYSSSDFCSGGEGQQLSEDVSFTPTLKAGENLYVAKFRMTKATIQVEALADGDVEFYIGEDQITSFEKETSANGSSLYTFTCNVGDEVKFVANPDKTFDGWWKVGDYEKPQSDYYDEETYEALEAYYDNCIGGYEFFEFEPEGYYEEFTITIDEGTFANWELIDGVYKLTAKFYVPDTVVEYTVLDQLTCAITHVGADYFNDERTSFEIPQKVTIDGKEYTVTAIGDNAFNGCRDMASVTIPNTITTIGKRAFFFVEKSEGGMKSIEIPNSVTSIGDSAFYACRYLEKVTLSTNITSIPDACFCDCWHLYSMNNGDEDGIVIPGNVKSIGSHAFDNLQYKLKKVIISEGVESIGYAAFYQCPNLQTFSVPTTLKYVDDDSFTLYFGHNNINSSVNPYRTSSEDGFTYLDSQDDKHVLLLGYTGTGTTATIDANCKIIYRGAFSGKSSLTSVTIPSGVTQIARDAFNGCSSLEAINIPEGVTCIGESAFEGCGCIVTGEGDNVNYDQKLTKVTIPSSLKSIGKNAFKFHNIVFVYNQYNYALYLGNDSNPTLCLVKAHSDDITSCNIDSDCRFILNDAFSGCSKMEQLNVPSAITFIGENAFGGLLNINYDGDCGSPTDTWGAFARNGVVEGDFVYADDLKTKLVKYKGSATEVIIPDGVEIIGENAFSDINITSVIIPESVETIEAYAFSGCTGIKSLDIPETVTSIGGKYGYSAFDGIININYNGPADPRRACDENWGANYMNKTVDENFVYEDADKTILKKFIGDATEVEIPNTVTTIGERSLYNMNITSVSIPASVTKIGEDAFNRCDNLQKATFASVADLCKIAFANEYSNPMYPKEYAEVELYFGTEENRRTNLEIPSGVESIGQYAFYNCKQLESVSIPASVQRIGANAFGRCNYISQMTIAEPSNGSGLQEIGYKAFNQCKFHTIVLPNTLTTIGNNAFDDCDSLISVVVPESVTSMGGYAFSYIEHDVVIFCLETNDDNNANRFKEWDENWDGVFADQPNLKVAVVKENRKTEQPNIVREEVEDGNCLLYFVYRNNGEGVSNINEGTLNYLITIRDNVTFQNGDAFAIGYHGTRNSPLNLVVPAMVGNNNPVVAIARNAFYGENLTYFTLGSSDGSKGATPLQSNMKIIGKGAFGGITSEYGFYSQNTNWKRYNGSETSVGQLTADELKQNSCNSEYFVDE